MASHCPFRAWSLTDSNSDVTGGPEPVDAFTLARDAIILANAAKKEMEANLVVFKDAQIRLSESRTRQKSAEVASRDAYRKALAEAFDFAKKQLDVILYQTGEKT